MRWPRAQVHTIVAVATLPLETCGASGHVAEDRVHSDTRKGPAGPTIEAAARCVVWVADTLGAGARQV